MPDLLGLPPEIKALIITLIRRHSDLRACYRTCKALYEDAIPRVYSRITLNENIPVPILCSLLKHENSGLKHIRHLKVTSGLSKAAHERIKFNNVLHLLANLLPRDVLLSFMSVSSSRMSVLVRTGLTLRSLDTTRDVDPSALGILYPRQRRLQTLRYVSNIYPKLNVPCGISTDNISTIQLMIEDHFVLRGARECLLEAPMLRHLEIHVSMAAYCTSRKLKFTDGLHRATASESIIAGLMGEVDLQSDDEAWPEHRRLSSLRLHGLSLSGVGIHLVKAIDIRRLTSLSLQCCEQEDSLLRMLAEDSDHSCLQLEHLAIAQSPDARTKTSSSEALDDFLSSFDTLSSLIISAPHTAALTPDLGALANHSDTLRALYLNCDFTGSSEAYDNCYEPFAIEEYLCECKKLEQLALNFPRTYINPIMLREDEDFNDFTDSLGLLQSLRTLHVFNPPSMVTSYTPSSNDGGHTYVQTSVKALADYLFEALPDISALSVGRCSTKPQYAGSVSLVQRFFARGRLIDPDGRCSVAAVATTRADLREMEPLSDLLDLKPEEAASFIRYGSEG